LEGDSAEAEPAHCLAGEAPHPLEDREESYHAPQCVTGYDIFDNRFIVGDNLLTLKTLEQEVGGTNMMLGD